MTVRVTREALQACRRCDLWRHATQAVPGEGPRHPRIVVVGEQPGDREDLSGRPFVGPAGAMLDRALEQAGIERADVYVTNAVKHFKFEQRGRLRLHSKPSPVEIRACNLWLQEELTDLRPGVVLALGATAARAVLGRTVTVGQARREPRVLPSGIEARVTVHPSYLLRIRDETDRAREYRGFVADLRAAMQATHDLGYQSPPRRSKSSTSPSRP